MAPLTLTSGQVLLSLEPEGPPSTFKAPCCTVTILVLTKLEVFEAARDLLSQSVPVLLAVQESVLSVLVAQDNHQDCYTAKYHANLMYP